MARAFLLPSVTSTEAKLSHPVGFIVPTRSVPAASSLLSCHPCSAPRENIVRSVCSSADEWKKKMRYTQAVKKKKTMTFVGKAVQMETIMLGEMRQTWGDKHHMFSLTCRP